jgi:transglutaminase-like putative cysteine protease
MARLAKLAGNDPAFCSAARSLGSVVGVDRFIRSHYRYRDEVEEIVRTPQFMLNDLDRIGWIEGDCDDVSTLYAAFVSCLGLPARFVAIRYNANNPNFEHVFTQAYDGGKWITLDATVPGGTPMDAIEEMVEAL